MSIAQLEQLNLAYLDEGEGESILLIHGFASTRFMNWVGPGWVKALTQAGYRVIAHDNRGHGESSKYYRQEDYSLQVMAEDALALLDLLKIDKCHMMGYSMGARITATLAVGNPERVSSIILGGNGYGMVEGTGDWSPVRDALLANSLDDVTDPRGRAFRSFADQTESDREALAACVMGVREPISEASFASIKNPVLVAIGTDDDVAGSPDKLVQLMPNGRYLPIPNRDHMRAVGDKVYINGVLEFLAEARF